MEPLEEDSEEAWAKFLIHYVFFDMAGFPVEMVGLGKEECANIRKQMIKITMRAGRGRGGVEIGAYEKY